MESVKLILFLCSLHCVYCVFTVNDYQGSERKDVLEWRKKCITLTGVTEQMIDGLRNGHFRKQPKAKEYLACIWLVSGVIDINFNIDAKKFDKYLPTVFTEKQAEKYDRCYTMTKSLDNVVTFVDKIWIMTQCEYYADPKNFIMI